MKVEKILQKLERESWAKDVAIKEEILAELRNHGDMVIVAISKLSEDAWPRKRYQACKLLRYLAAIDALWLLEDERSKDILMRALKDPDGSVRVGAVHELILIEEIRKTGEAIPQLIEILKNDTDPNIRADTAFSLGSVKWRPEVIQALMQSLADNDYTTKESLYGTSCGFTVSHVAAEALTKIGDKRCLAALAPYLIGQCMWNVEHTVEVFKSFGQAAAEYLIAGLKDNKWQSRERAAASLGEIGSIEAVIPLIHALGDDHHKVRRAVAEALGKLGDARALEALTKAREDKTSSVRGAAESAIKKIQKNLL
jgi:HEAT repeat protein